MGSSATLAAVVLVVLLCTAHSYSEGLSGSRFLAVGGDPKGRKLLFHWAKGGTSDQDNGRRKLKAKRAFVEPTGRNILSYHRHWKNFIFWG
ncbi:hypothetical protein BSKO_02795 [Bryopsis sp. KO-2023]|nr:hypothetical protein BSKO_02795 [Bryopsis sp. KO-2023]